MRNIVIGKNPVEEGSRVLSGTDTSVRLLLPASGGGILLPQIRESRERYLSFYLTVEEAHSMAMHLLLYEEGEEEPAFTLRFGVLGRMRTFVCIDLELLEAGTLFPEAAPGALKMVCHGRRIERGAIAKAYLGSLPCFHEIRAEISDMTLTDEYPGQEALPDAVLVDPLGQNRKRDWPGKLHGPEELAEKLRKQRGAGEGYPFADWSAYGGWKRKKLTDGTGFFAKKKIDGKWWLTDPEGYAFFSMGPDCVRPGGDCRIDGVEKWLEWLPARDDAEYGAFFHDSRPGARRGRRKFLAYDFVESNLCRAFGKDWFDQWKIMITGQLKAHGMNTLANWSDGRILGTTGMPYVTSLEEFPSTKQNIFRDFPDVFSPEYAENARRCAQSLKARKDDPYMIGYFLRNEPAWAFVDNLIIADEVLYCEARTACKERLIDGLRAKYGTVEALNAAWGCAFAGFEDLYRRQVKLSARSGAAEADLKEFSRKMLRAYMEIPSRECRKVDPNHMILGMRWAWISDPDLVTGWENFDVFSINCYAMDPTEAIDRVVSLKVDLPVMIGEFHFGALDRGPEATGLEAVRTQKDRGIAYRHYCERAAAHPYGVGCHYFQCYDQFLLGRFDGENYNIGLFDICSQPYPEMMEQVRACSEGIYEVAAGLREPFAEKAEEIPMIAY